MSISLCHRHGTKESVHPALMGIDISGSLKTGLPFTSLAGAQGTPADTVYGVYAGLGKKGLNAMNAAEREDYLRALEFASPSFMEAALKALRMADQGATTARGKASPTSTASRSGWGPARRSPRLPASVRRGWRGSPASIGRWRTCRATSRNGGDDLYARYRLAKTPEDRQKVIRDMQRFNMDARKYRGVISPITETSLRQTASQRPEKPFLAFGRMVEANAFS